MNLDYLIFFAVMAIIAIFAWVGCRNSLHYAREAADISEMLINVKCDIEGDDEAYARILKLSVGEYKTERKKGRVLYLAGMRIRGISEGLRSPFRVWR
jgi:hypothetical protein